MQFKEINPEDYYGLPTYSEKQKPWLYNLDQELNESIAHIKPQPPLNLSEKAWNASLAAAPINTGTGKPIKCLKRRANRYIRERLEHAMGMANYNSNIALISFAAAFDCMRIYKVEPRSLNRAFHNFQAIGQALAAINAQLPEANTSFQQAACDMALTYDRLAI